MAKKQHFVLVLNLEKMEELKIQEKTFCWWERNQRPNSVLERIREPYETLFKKWNPKAAVKVEKFYSDVNIPKLFQNQAKLEKKI